jgi:hypothetical protein
MPTAREVTIPPGGGVITTWGLHGNLGTKIQIQNLGPGACELEERDQPPLAGEDRIIRAGTTKELELRDGSHKLVLAIRSVLGSKVKLVVVDWRPAPPPTYILSKRREIERDPRTHTISSITEIPIWVLQEPR